MSQSIEVVGCRVCRQAGLMENYGDVFDQLSLDAYIQLAALFKRFDAYALQHSCQEFIFFFTRKR